MTIRIGLAAMLAALTSIPTESANASDDLVAPPLAASSKWNLDYGLESCQLARTFGEGEAAVTLYLRQTRPGIFFNLTLAGDRFGKPRRAVGTKAHFGDLEERKFSESAWISQASDGRPVLLLGINTFAEWDDDAKSWISATPEDLERIDRLDFEVPRLDRFALASGPMDKPMAAMKNCFADLMTTWGFDLGTYESLARPPLPLTDPSKWIASQSYPRGPMSEGEGAILDLRLVVDGRGSVESCVVQNTIGAPVFARAACQELVNRQLFTPALDAASQPVRTLWFSSVRYQAR